MAIDPSAVIAPTARVHPEASIGAQTVIGDYCVIEHYTISRGTQPDSITSIGDGNYIMTSGHIAHNCKIGNDTVIASCALVAGYVTVEDQAFISGGVAIHQYSKIGR